MLFEGRSELRNVGRVNNNSHWRNIVASAEHLTDWTDTSVCLSLLSLIAIDLAPFPIGDGCLRQSALRRCHLTRHIVLCHVYIYLIVAFLVSIILTHQIQLSDQDWLHCKMYVSDLSLYINHPKVSTHFEQRIYKRLYIYMWIFIITHIYILFIPYI
jgi:hypothetical protein